MSTTVEELDVKQDTSKDMLSMQERLELAQEKKDQVQREFISAKDVNVKETSNGDVVVDIPIQSISQDRDGDRITEQGQKRAIKQLKSGTVGMFPNHGIGDGDAMYDFRDLFGQFIDGSMEDSITLGRSRMRKAMDDKDELHPHAKQVVDLLEQDMPIGFSIGFIPKDFNETKDGEMEITDLDLMEVSAVGIPSNPDAVPQALDSAVAMAKSAREEGVCEEKVAKAFDKALRDTMTDKDKVKDTDKKDVKSEDEKTVKTVEELVKSTREQKQLNPDEVDTVMEIINLHNEAVKEDIRAFMEDQDLIEEDSQDSETDSEHDEDEEESDYDDDKDDDKEVETNGSDQNEDKSGEDESAESENKENKETEQEESEETEKGLSEEEKTLSKKENESGKSENKINTLDKDSDSSESKSEKDFEDPFKITPNSKA